jgi:type I restriction enzyme S subunit
MGFERTDIALGEILTLQRGIDLPAKDRKGGDVPVIASTGVVGYHNLAPVKGPGVVIGRSGSIGGGQYISTDFWPLNTTLWVKDFKGNNPRYCYYLLRSMDFSSLNAGSGVPTLNRNHLHPILVYRLPLSEQKAIASFLGAIDDRIILLRETNKTLESIAQAIFKSWFVDFDPVRAKMEGRQPEGMDEETAGLFPNEFEESELGLIPKGWRIVRLDELLTLSYGKALRATERVSGEVPVYGSGGITGYHNQSIVEGPSIIIGRKGTVGSLYWEDSPFFPIDTVFYVKSAFPLTFCFYLLQIMKLSDMNTDAAVPGLNRNNVYRLKVALPTSLILNSFDDVVTIIRQKILKNNEAAKSLESTRDLLLPRLISGQLRLSDPAEAKELAAIKL